MTPNPQDSAVALEVERAAFEAWAPTNALGLTRGLGDEYKSIQTEEAWSGWKARAALASTTPCAALEPVADGRFWAPPDSFGANWLTNGAALHPLTVNLVVRFARSLAEKLAAAEVKYGYSDGWRSSDWMDECRAKLLEHVAKGDPRDVAAYCAFLWHHGEKTFVPTKADPYEALMNEVMACGGEVTPREIIFNHATFDMFMQRHVGKTALDHFADEVEATLCQACNGSGEQQFMTQGHGPDDYEVTGLCSKCGGTGAAIAAATEGAAS